MAFAFPPPRRRVRPRLITFDKDHRLVLSKRLKEHLPQRALQENFVAYEGDLLQVPAQTLGPRPEFIAYHRETVFKN